MAYEPSQDEIDARLEDVRRRRAAAGLAPNDAAERNEAYRSASTQQRDANQSLLGGLSDDMYGKQVSTGGIEREAQKMRELADRMASEYGNAPTYMTPSLSLSAADQASRGRASAYAQEGVIAARDMGDRQPDLARQERALALAEDAAMGRAPSVAEIQGQQQLQQALQSQLAMAARARGGNMSLALRSAGQNAAQMQGQAAQNAAMLRAQEMATAREQFASGSDVARRTSLDASKSRAELMRQAAAQYGAESGSQIETALKMQQANAGFQTETREQSLREQDRRRQAALSARAQGLAGQQALFGANVSNKRGIAPLVNAGAQAYMAYASGGSSGGGNSGGTGSSGTQVNFSQ